MTWVCSALILAVVLALLAAWILLTYYRDAARAIIQLQLDLSKCNSDFRDSWEQCDRQAAQILLIKGALQESMRRRSIAEFELWVLQTKAYVRAGSRYLKVAE